MKMIVALGAGCKAMVWTKPGGVIKIGCPVKSDLPRVLQELTADLKEFKVVSARHGQAAWIMAFDVNTDEYVEKLHRRYVVTHVSTFGRAMR